MRGPDCPIFICGQEVKAIAALFNNVLPIVSLIVVVVVVVVVVVLIQFIPTSSLTLLCPVV